MEIPPGLELLISFIVVVVGYINNRWSNQAELKKIRQAQQALEAKMKLDQEEFELKRRKNDAELSDQFLQIADKAGEQVVVHLTTINSLQKDINALKAENAEKDKRINILEAENAALLKRIEALEAKNGG